MSKKIDIVVKYDELATQANILTLEDLKYAFNDETPKQDSNYKEYFKKNTDFYLEKYIPLFTKHLHNLTHESVAKQINGE
ncbi:hypothetical protein [Mammaliicoccus sciuri]|uniref:hypothetical protein n=1 Tax=Mammaliicoccus sciuri TaxID=1296 RepID=UPI001C4E7EED|nr:hypothetical protein [Mammaliicoccus sciuri]